jgi:hypothetical protein
MGKLKTGKNFQDIHSFASQVPGVSAELSFSSWGGSSNSANPSE